jgi:Asp-tRNA(Asn)/Glu-tRNA(Gln) amidotransferase A subunit family amidase
METTGDNRFQNPWSFLRWPAASLPIAWSSEGFPIAIQLVGPLLSDRALVQFAAQFEKAVGFKRPPLPI